MKFKRLISSVLTAMLVISAASVPLSASADEVFEIPQDSEAVSSKLDILASGDSDISEYYSGSNLNAQNYTNALRWTLPITSYLSTCDDGTIMRFQNNDSCSGYLVEYFDSSFTRLSSKLVPKEMDIFGGFYTDGSNNFVISGQQNYEEDDSKEVIRITKYDKNWNRLSSASLYGANTVDPFQAGSLRMDTCGKYLLIRTSHKMYKSSDGNNHQANVTIEYDMYNSKITDSYTAIMNNNYGYVSHSFNQFIKVENNSIVAVDHGDAHPRSVAVLKYSTDCSGGKFTKSSSFCTVIDAVPMSGSTGENDTGVAVGGFEISDSSYLIAGNIVADSTQYKSSSASRNVYVAAVNKFTSAVNMNLITNYTSSDSGVVNPQFAKIDSNRFIVMWSVKGNTSKVYYTEIDGSGNQVGSVYEMDASLSDCAPKVINNQLTWYVWNNNKVSFYQISVNDISNVSSKTVGYNSPVVNNSYLGSSTVTTGEYASLYLRASGGTGSFTYDLFVRRKGSSGVVMSRTGLTSSGIRFSLGSSGEYEVQVDAIDSDGTKTSKTMPLTFANASDPLTNNSTVDKTAVSVGDTVKLSGAASGGSGSYTYTYNYRLKGASSWTVIGTANTSSTTANFVPNASGSYELMVKTTDSDGTTAEKTFDVTVTDKLTNNSTISSANVYTGDKLVITGAASGGEGDYKYAFYYKKSSDSSYTLKGTEFGSDTSVTLYPSYASAYNIQIKVKDSSGKVSTKTYIVNVKEGLKNSSAISAKTAYVGDKVTVTGAATGGAGSCKYAFYYKQHSKTSWTLKSAEFGSDTSVDIYPAYAAAYDIMVKAKDNDGKIVSKTMTLDVKPTLKNNSKVSSASVYKGSKLTVTGAATGGAGSCKYAFYFRQKGKTEWTLKGTEYGTATSVDIYPGTVTKYEIMVKVKDSNGRVVSKTMTVDVKQPLTNKSTVSKTTAKVGDQITITGAASGGAGSCKYAFYYKQHQNSTWNTKGTVYGSDTTVYLNPKYVAKYDVMVKVKDASGTIVTKTFTIDVSK